MKEQQTTGFITLNLHFGQKFDLSTSELILTAYYFAAPAWAKHEKFDGLDYYFLSRNKVIADLPILTDKPDTIYRLTKSLVKKGIINHISISKRDYIAPNKELVEAWYKMELGNFSESRIKNTSEKLGNFSEKEAENSENFPKNARKNFRQTDSYIITDSYINTESYGKIENFAPTQTTENTNFEVPFDENCNPINEHPAKQQKPKLNNVAPQRVKNTLTPTLDEVLQEALKKGLSPETAKYEASQFFNYYDSVGWQYGKGRKITRWRSAFAGWLNRAEQWANKDKQRTSNPKPDQQKQAADRNYDEIADFTINSLLNQYPNGNYR